MSVFLELAERCEQATGPSPDLDKGIAVACRHTPTNRPRYYTASLDAAMTLVREGHGWRLWVPNSESPEPSPFVTLWGNRREYAPRDSIAATPALALCAAALRARASQSPEQGID